MFVEVHTGVFTDTTMLPMLTGLADAAESAGAITRGQADTWMQEQIRRADDGRLSRASTSDLVTLVPMKLIDTS